MDPAGYRPGLASRWEQVDSVTWRFHLRSDRIWHDGRSVRARDVVFAVEAHQNAEFQSPAEGSLANLAATAEDDSTVVIRFESPRPDQLYDATWHVRVFPAHGWDSLPPASWGEVRAADRFVGSGPYRVTEWVRGQHLALEAVDAEAAIRRVIWRFTEAPEPAANLVLSGEADLLETLPDPARRPEFERDPTLRLESYPSAVYGFLGFNLARTGAWSDNRVRRALALAVDRDQLATLAVGPGTVVPPGPLSRQLWLWEDGVTSMALDTVAAAALLDSAGWRAGGDGIRRRGAVSLRLDILVPGTSASRRNLAVALQERWRRIGVEVSVTSVDFAVFQERLDARQFDSFIGAWLDEPNPRSLRDQWTRAGWERLNYGRYNSPAFDSLLDRAVSTSDPGVARSAWRAALAQLNQDAPAIWLYTLTNTAAVSNRIDHPPFQPFGWLGRLEGWRIRPPGR